MIRGIVFDFDQTLVDSSPVEALRRAKNWSRIYSNLNLIRVYDGIHELLANLKQAGIKLAIVTSGPASYCTKVMRHHRIAIDVLVGYHDTIRKKPAPDPIEEAVRRLKLGVDEVASIGDDPKDIQASKAAGVLSIAATWGAADVPALLSAKPDHLVSSIAELESLLGQL